MENIMEYVCVSILIWVQLMNIHAECRKVTKRLQTMVQKTDTHFFCSGKHGEELYEQSHLGPQDEQSAQQ